MRDERDEQKSKGEVKKVGAKRVTYTLDVIRKQGRAGKVFVSAQPQPSLTGALKGLFFHGRRALFPPPGLGEAVFSGRASPL